MALSYVGIVKNRLNDNKIVYRSRKTNTFEEAHRRAEKIAQGDHLSVDVVTLLPEERLWGDWVLEMTEKGHVKRGFYKGRYYHPYRWSAKQNCFTSTNAATVRQLSTGTVVLK